MDAFLGIYCTRRLRVLVPIDFCLAVVCSNGLSQMVSSRLFFISYSIISFICGYFVVFLIVFRSFDDFAKLVGEEKRGMVSQERRGAGADRSDASQHRGQHHVSSQQSQARNSPYCWFCNEIPGIEPGRVVCHSFTELNWYLFNFYTLYLFCNSDVLLFQNYLWSS